MTPPAAFFRKVSLSCILGLGIALLGLTRWEFHWRARPGYYRAHLDDDRDLWAQERKRVEQATQDDIIILGSSRTGFNFRTYIWEELTGKKTINLSGDGKTPAPM
ncbi:MAG: hypothetical protein AAF804_09220, partial [Bacteroidota bacterium]